MTELTNVNPTQMTQLINTHTEVRPFMAENISFSF
jgi:hypothetical protein